MKESILKKKNQIIPLLQPEHRFCQQNGLERGQVQDLYTNEKMVVVPVCLNDRYCSSECVGGWVYHINKNEGDDSLPFPAFRRMMKYSKEGKSSLSHVGIQNLRSDVCYDDAKHYQVPSR